MIKVGYISPVNPETDRMSWSGTYYNSFHAIKNTGLDIKWIPYTSHKFLYKVTTKFAKVNYKLVYGNGSADHSRFMEVAHKYLINKNILDDVDLIFVPGQIDIVAGLRTDKPIIYYTDGTFKSMINYYWFGFSRRAINEGNKLEKLAISRAKFNFRASHWAANSTIKDYGAKSDHTYVFPFGADVPKNINRISIPDYKNKRLKLMFSGKDWMRKGGNIAVATAEYLNQIGINTELFIVGPSSLPKDITDKKFVHFIGYINKNDKSDYKKYFKIYYECNAFILPTRAECAGLVFCEANAFGMPIFSTDTGGISDYVKNKVNGYRLPLSANGQDFGKCIEKVYKEKRFDILSEGARKMYQTSNNWEAWSRHFKDFVDKNRLEFKHE